MYAYVADYYKPQSAEIGILMNLSRRLSFCRSFFVLPFAEAVGYGDAWLTFAMILFASWLPNLGLMIWGEKWRKNVSDSLIYNDL